MCKINGSEDMKRKTRRELIIFLVGIAFTMSSHYSVAALQSSTNIDDGLGVTSLAVMNGIVLITAFFLSPVALKFINIKSGLVFADAAMLAFVLANFYPVAPLLLVTSALTGLGKAFYWICCGGLNIDFAKRLDKYGSKDFTSYISDISGSFMCALLGCQIFGNLISFAVFELMPPPENTNPSIHTTTQSVINSSTSFEQLYKISDVCGANDCQDESLSNISSNYHPQNQIALYIAVGIFAAFNLMGLLLHLIFLPNPNTESVDEVSNQHSTFAASYDNNTFAEENLNNNVGKQDKLPGKFDNDNDDGIHKVLKHGLEMQYDNKSSIEKQWHYSDSTDNSFKTDESKVCNKKYFSSRNQLCSAWTELKESWLFIFKPLQMLLTVTQIHLGLNTSFAYGEITRAYVSCVFGVKEVGISMSIYGAAALISSLFCGKIAGRFGRTHLTSFTYVANAATYLFWLLWTPTENSSVGIVFAMMFAAGFVDGCVQTLSAILVPIAFPNETRKGLTWWTISCTIGVVINFSWSTSLCVRTKLYIQLGILLLSAIAHATVEYLIRISARRDVDESKPTEEDDVKCSKC